MANETELEAQDIEGESDALRVVGALMQSSQWLQVTPLPDDEWRITVKKENAILLARIVSSVLNAPKAA